MNTILHGKVLSASALGMLALCLGTVGLQAQSNTFKQTNLVSDLPGMAAHTDSDLVNPWGISESGGSPFWVSDNGTGKTTLYNSTGVKQGLVVSMPLGSEPITGQVFANVAGSFNGDAFLFANEHGTLTGWRGALGTTAEVLATTPGGEFKGLALGKTGGNTYAYAADFGNSAITVIKGSAAAPNLAGTFTDPTLPAGYAPFNVQNIGGTLYVTYAMKGSTGDDVGGAGHGFVDTYDLNGNFQARLVSQGKLDSPWGLALAPAGFGPFGGDLLVGNFGDGSINAYDPTSGMFMGSLLDPSSTPISIDGLWGLTFGNGGNGGAKNTLYFAAGIAGPDNTEDHGLFGSLSHVPDAGSSLVMASAALLGFLAVGRRLVPSHALRS